MLGDQQRKSGSLRKVCLPSDHKNMSLSSPLNSNREKKNPFKYENRIKKWSLNIAMKACVSCSSSHAILTWLQTCGWTGGDVTLLVGSCDGDREVLSTHQVKEAALISVWHAHFWHAGVSLHGGCVDIWPITRLPGYHSNTSKTVLAGGDSDGFAWPWYKNI